MDRFLKLMFTLIVITAFTGCSTRAGNPVQIPNLPADHPLVETPGNTLNNQTLLGQWVMNFDLTNQTVQLEPLRTSSTHFNVTPFLPPEIVINSIDPTTETVNVDISMTNTFTVTGWDPRLIIYTDSAGHKLLNADEWTDLFDIPGGLPINPFKAYAKSLPQRQFFPSAEHTENLIIKLPGMNPSVKFAIEVSYPYSCPEPYWINEFTQDALFDIPTSSTQVGVYVFNWLGDTSAVYLYCPQVSGATLNSMTQNDYHWSGTIQNTMDANVGEYFCYIIAYTTVSGSQALYDEFTITVSRYGTPVTPEVISNLDTAGANGLDVLDNYAYIADSADGLKIIDITDPENPFVEGNLDNGYWFNDVAVNGNYAYAAAESNMYAINVQVKDTPFIEYTYNTSGSPDGVCIQYPYAYFALGWYSTWIFDITDPANWSLLGTFPENDWAYNVDVQGSLMMVADGGEGIQLIDIEDPEHPALIKVIETSSAYDVLIDGNYAYVADNGDGIRVVKDLYMPPSAYVVHSVDTTGSSNALALQDGFLYVACGASGVEIFDVSIPESAYIFSSFDTPGSCEDIVVHDRYAYIAEYAQGLTIAKLW
jgi:hypothetical protein